MKRLLCVIDYQNDFVTGSLGFEKAKSLDRNIASLIKDYRASGDTVAFTLDTHYEDYLSTSEGKMLPIKHCIEGTNGHKLYGETAKLAQNGDPIFIKNTFGSDKLYEFIKQNKFDKITFAGVVSNICVISNAILAKTASPESEITVNAQCVASNDESLNTAALNVMRSLQIIIEGE